MESDHGKEQEQLVPYHPAWKDYDRLSQVLHAAAVKQLHGKSFVRFHRGGRMKIPLPDAYTLLELSRFHTVSHFDDMLVLRATFNIPAIEPEGEFWNIDDWNDKEPYEGCVDFFFRPSPEVALPSTSKPATAPATTPTVPQKAPDAYKESPWWGCTVGAVCVVAVIGIYYVLSQPQETPEASDNPYKDPEPTAPDDRYVGNDIPPVIRLGADDPSLRGRDDPGEEFLSDSVVPDPLQELPEKALDQ